MAEKKKNFLRVRLVCMMSFVGLLPGCLKTHYQIAGAKENSKPAEAFEEKSSASLEERIRKLEKKTALMEKKFITRQEADTMVEALRKEVTRIDDQTKLLSSKPAQKKKEPSMNFFEKAEKHFQNKEYKKAIFAYEELRKLKPSNEHFKKATLKIGMSFVELDLNKEAEVFFKEIIEKFPDSEEAVQAQKLLKK